MKFIGAAYFSEFDGATPLHQMGLKDISAEPIVQDLAEEYPSFIYFFTYLDQDVT